MSLFKTWTGQSQKSQQSNHMQQDTQPQLQPSSPMEVSQHPSRPKLQQVTSNRSELHQVTSNGSNADPLAGQLNHLTEHQESQLEKFKAIILEQGLYRPAAEGHPPTHDDQTLL
jgi:hypothetical protein